MKYALIQNNKYKGLISYEPGMTSKERSIPGCEIWYLPDNCPFPAQSEDIVGIRDPRPFPNDIALQAIRNKRDALLAETDWIMLSDISMSESKKQKYLEYRQALRDLPSVFADNPNDVVWPTKP